MKYLLVAVIVTVQLCHCSATIDDGEPPIIYVQDGEGIDDSLDQESENSGADVLYRNHPEIPNLVEGDILLTPEQAAIYKESGWEGLVRSEAWEDAASMWPTVIPYVIDNSVNLFRDVAASIPYSLSLFEPTCIRFVPRGPDNFGADYITFRTSIFFPACATNVGRQPVLGSHDIFLFQGCTGAVAAHELLHALGRYHEHSRPDRDQYVIIHDENFENDSLTTSQFEIQPDANTLGLPYDYRSVMHYSSTAFQKAPGLLTITPVDPNISPDILGQIENLTALDIEHINRRYCNESLLWPDGTFSLPEPTSGCPHPNARRGFVAQNLEGDRNDVANHYRTSNPFHPLAVPDSVNGHLDNYYCTFTFSSNSQRQWPSGSYCIGRYGASCPQGFTEGMVFWDDDNAGSNIVSGAIPFGKYECDTRIHYCCRSDGPIDTPIVLPTAKPFLLWRQSADGCQQVQGMNVTVEWLFMDSEDDNNQNYIRGSAPYIEGTTDYTIYYCYYS